VQRHLLQEVIYMLINEAAKISKLTKKAIEYYIEQNLLTPVVMDNGYRQFSQNDIERLLKIAVLRRLDLSIADINAVLKDSTGKTLRKLSVKKELAMRKDNEKKTLLDELACGKDYEDIGDRLRSLEEHATIADKLLDAFPGYYGRFVCLHFSRFLNEPITTPTQQDAYRTIISFLDMMECPAFPEDLQQILEESTDNIKVETIQQMLENTTRSIENPEKFMAENHEIIENYLAFKQSEEYKNSPIYQLQELMKSFHTTSGYYDIFIPAMKVLSASYRAYYNKLELANNKLLLQYPEIEKLQ